VCAAHPPTPDEGPACSGSTLTPRSNAWTISPRRLRLGGRFPPEALPLVERLDGTTPLREAMRETGVAVDAVRELVAKGLLAPR
jgi:hypothetical protein